MRFRAILTLVTLFILTVFVACLGVAISSDALASQPHSKLFTSKEASEHASEEKSGPGHSPVPDRRHDQSRGTTGSWLHGHGGLSNR